MTKSYDNAFKMALMLLCVLATTLLMTEPAFAVNIGGLVTETKSFFTDVNNLLVVIGSGIGVVAFIWGCIEYFVNKSPLMDCAKYAGVAVLVGAAVAIIGAAVDFGKSM